MTTQQKDIFEEMEFASLLDSRTAESIKSSNMVRKDDDWPEQSGSSSMSVSSYDYTVDEARIITQVVSPRKRYPSRINNLRMEVEDGCKVKDLLASDTSTTGETIISLDTSIGETQDPPPVVRRIMKRCGIAQSGTEIMYKVRIKDIPMTFKTCKRSEIAAQSEIIQNLKTKLLKELNQVYYINNVIDTDVTNKMKQEVVVEARPKLNSKLAKLLQELVVLAWIIMELDAEQHKLYCVVEEKEIDITGQQISLKIEDLETKLPAASLPPVIQPLPSDCKFGMLDLRRMLHLKDFIFKEKDIRAEARIELAKALDQSEYATLLQDPMSVFVHYIRYLQLSAVEFINYCYYTSEDGKPRQAYCPCGIVMNRNTLGIVRHEQSCRFQAFLQERLPSLVNGNVISPQPIRILTERESDYLRNVIAKRKPQRKIIKDIRGEVHMDVHPDGREHIIKIVPLSEDERHRLTCSARQACYKCKYSK